MFESSIEFSSYDAEALRGKGLIVTEHEDLGIAIVRYHKSDNEWKTRTHGECDRTDATVKNHRSVVYSLTTGLPLSVAPTRRVLHNAVGNGTFSDDEDEFMVTEYLDGTTINVFWNPTINSDTGASFGWTLASRSKIHATCRFTSDRLFRELFEEARVNSGVDYDSLNPRYCYSFVMLHPENRRVLSCESARVVLVSVASCVPHSDAGSGDIVSSYATQLGWDEMYAEGNRLATDILPRKVDIEAGGILRYSMLESVSGTLAGWMITKKSGSWGRVRVLTDGFERCAFLRGDTASRRTNYIRLMSLDPRGDAIREYAKWYPEEESDIKTLGDEIKAAISELIKNYVSRHVKKTKEHTDLPHWTRRPIWDLHGRYIRMRVPIKEAEVFAYFRDIAPSAVNRMLKNREKENHKAAQTAAAAAAASAAEAMPTEEEDDAAAPESS